MKSLKYIALLSIVFSIACRKEINIDIPNDERKIVLNTVVSADCVFYAQVYRSNHAQDNSTDLLYLNNAKVEVYESDNLVEVLSIDKLGYYSGNELFAKENKTYEFRVDVPNLESVSGKAEVKSKVPIISIDSVGITKIYSGSMDYIVYKVKFEDEPNVDDYYRLRIFMDDINVGGDTVWYGEGKDDYYIQYPDNYYGSLNYEPIDASVEVWPYFDNYTYFTDRLFDGDSYGFEIAIPYYDENPASFYVSLEHISYEFFRYVQSVDAQNDTEDMALFSQPVQVFINVENGYGIVGSTNASIDSVIYEPSVKDSMYYK